MPCYDLPGWRPSDSGVARSARSSTAEPTMLQGIYPEAWRRLAGAHAQRQTREGIAAAQSRIALPQELRGAVYRQNDQIILLCEGYVDRGAFDGLVDEG